MMKNVLIAVFIVIFYPAMAQTIKTDVLVIGGGAAGVAAGIQAARSNVKTLLIEPGPWLGGALTSGAMCIVEGNSSLPSGIWGEFRKDVRDFYKSTPGFDTAQNATLRFEPYTGAAILKKITDTIKHLTVKLNTNWKGIKKNGDEWDVTFDDNGKTNTIKARVVIDGTETGDVAAKAGAEFDSGFESKQITGESIAPVNAPSVIQEITWCAVLKDYGPAADRTVAKPDSYNPALYACLKGKDIKKMLQDGKLPNDKYLIKWAGCANSYAATIDELSPEGRKDFYAECRLKTLGLIYYLETELGYKNLGIDFQEFDTPDHLPSIPYIREAGRGRGLVRLNIDDILSPYNRPSKLYRTSIAVGDAMPGQHFPAGSGAPQVNYPAFPGYCIPIGAVVLKDFENLLVTEKALSATHLANASSMYPSVQMTLGQGAGALAAYCAFFKTSTKNLEVRKVQAEILDFKGYLMPFVDISQKDPHFRAIQQIGATGLLKGVKIAKSKLAAAVYFQPDSLVKTAEVKPVLLEMYARSFLWFNKVNPSENFTMANLLSFISELTLTDPKNLELGLQKAWKSKFKLPGEFNANRPVTRREFAVLANAYINPFGRRVDISGKLLN